MTTIIPKICLIAARGRNNVIGAEGDLPWRLSSDLQLFKATTSGKPVIMGRKTWESLPRRPLPQRLNIVLTRQPAYEAEDAHVVSELGDAMNAAFARANADRVDEVFVIGGAQIYAATFEMADRLYLTEVDAEPEGEAVFPEFDETLWREAARDVYPAGEKDEHAFVFRALHKL